MLKQTLMGLGIAAIASTSMLVTDAEAGGRHHYKFKFHHGYHNYGWGDDYGRGCYHYKKKYYRTGYKYWLEKYYDCKDD